MNLKKLPHEELERRWFEKTLYQDMTVFPTMSDHPAFHHFIVSKIRELVPNASEETGVEIGPGHNPVLPALPFKKMLFVDLSKPLAGNLQNTMIPIRRDAPDRGFDYVPFSKLAQGRSIAVVGDIRRLPLSVEKKAGLIVVNNVLTHIKPGERNKVVAGLAEKTRALLIVDNHYESKLEIRARLRNFAEMVQKSLSLQPESKEKQERMHRSEKYLHPTKQMLESEQQKMVNVKNIKRELAENGWKVATSIVRHPLQKIVILQARRS
ncbi:hypothetical protein HY993_01380 [Candidatus Micrarchaeota archaeon]|nr:hypothetical protein [Candidatus Micrarchaeota archaeon]